MRTNLYRPLRRFCTYSVLKSVRMIETQAIPASWREFNVLVFGASGFTGKEVMRYIHKHSSFESWAICGRSESKLKNSLTEVTSETSCESGAAVDPTVLVADVADRDLLIATFRRTALVLNCSGPYRFLGEPVVEACIAAGADYMDISGEPQFMEDMFLKYHEQAKAARTLIIHACAFDSVPADLGVLLTTRHFDRDCCNSISSFLTINSGPSGFAGHYTTFECAVHGFSDVESLRSIRKKIAEKFNIPALKPPGPVAAKRPTFFYDANEKKYAMTFMGADASVVRSSHRSLKERGILDLCAPQYSAFVTVPSLLYLGVILVFGFVMQFLAGFSWGRTLLLKYPGLFTNGVFSHKGPSKEQLQSTSFKMTLYGIGFNAPDSNDPPVVVGRKYNDEPPANQKKVVRVVIEGPEPGYVATPIFLVALANCLRVERADMPAGGVVTPAAAFHDSESIFKRLNAAGIKISAYKIKK